MIVPVSGKVIGAREKEYMHQAVDEGWLTSGKWCAEFEKRLRAFTGKREVVLCNSGSSANLLAMLALRDRIGPRTISTCVLGFPTTLAAILEAKCQPEFYDVDPDWLMSAGSPDFTASILGYSTPRSFVADLCDGMGIDTTGITTYSFYPAHTITTGEGGAIATDNPALAKIMRSYRDWGRDCWCEPGCDNTCGKRFAGEYDHKYTYTRIGYNLKMTDIQAACGCAQMERLPEFLRIRRQNWDYLSEQLAPLSDFFDFPKPLNPDNFAPFGFPLICKPPIKRNEIARWLDERGVKNRPIMGGNLLRQPAFAHLGNPADFPGADRLHYHAFWIGSWHGLTQEHLDYSVSKIKEFVCAS